MNMKYLLLLFGLLTFFNPLCEAQQHGKINKIVLDAGHGGTDPGCLGKKSKEKEVNLNVALKVGKLIAENHDDVKVIYTRKTDVAVELYKRAEIGNNNHADLFISIHCNAAENKNARGVETYVMGLHKTDANLAVAKKENAAILQEINYENNYDGFDPNSPESNIIFSIYSSAYLKYSAMLAAKVQRNLVMNTQLTDRNVQQAGFWVLYKVAMPSILIELGFLSNVQEENDMIKPESQDLMAISIYNAFVEYKNQVEGTNKPTLPVTTAVAQFSGKSDEVASNTISDTKTNNTPTTDNNTKVETDQPAETGKNGEMIRFRIQFMTSSKDIPITDKQFSNMKTVKKYHENNLWKFTSGDEAVYEDAMTLLKTVKANYPDAFLVAYKNGKKISVTEARELLKKI
ncbi:MAG: N-acetylmuramoyl-L-alanine amidase [Bacteroidales bacterium]|jgi:N-acetylmuramoyl-L-alanine amidase|nr:N-acetylmuramoyl-L-alanine amidase [Bacteroidales bacterium]